MGSIPGKAVVFAAEGLRGDSGDKPAIAPALLPIIAESSVPTSSLRGSSCTREEALADSEATRCELRLDSACAEGAAASSSSEDDEWSWASAADRFLWREEDAAALLSSAATSLRRCCSVENCARKAR